MRFTAVISYELGAASARPSSTRRRPRSPQRPDKLRVITPGDGPASEFYYDGKTMMAFEPAANLIAVADAPPTLDAALKAAYDNAAIYFPFTDVIVADPHKGLADGLKHAFYIGQSRVVGGTTTDMVAIVNNWVFEQLWIGADDKLPRKARAVFLVDPARLRHEMELSNWQLDPTVPAEAFVECHQRDAHRVHPPGPEAPAWSQATGAEQAIQIPLNRRYHEMHGHWPRRFLAHGTRAVDRPGPGRVPVVWHRLRRGWLLECQRLPWRHGLRRWSLERHRLPWRHGLRRRGFRSGSVAARPLAAGARSAPAPTAARPPAVGGLARDQPLWHDGVSLVSLRHDGLWHDGLRRVPLLRWHLRGVPSAHYRELLWLLVRQLRGLVHLPGRPRCRGRHGRWAAVASANTAAATSSAYSAGHAAGATTTAYAMGAIYATLPTGCAVSAAPAQPTTTAPRRGSSRPTARTASTTVVPTP